MTIFFRLLQSDDKEAALTSAVQAAKAGQSTGEVFGVLPSSFLQVPGSPFAYWVSETLRRKFNALPPFESQGRTLRIGDHPGDGFRWLRLHFEVPIGSPTARDWRPYHKGGTNSPYFDDVPLVVDWDAERQTYRDFYGRRGRPNERPSNYQHFFKSGITFPYLPHRRGHFAHVAPGGAFGHASPILQLPRSQHWATCALLNSDAYIGLLHMLMPRGGAGGGQTLKYEVCYVRAVPIPNMDAESIEILSALAEAAYRLRYECEQHNECRRLFSLPSYCLPAASGQSLQQCLSEIVETKSRLDRRLGDIQRKINDVAFRLYGIDGNDRHVLEALLETRPHDTDQLDEADQGEPSDVADEEDRAEVGTELPSMIRDLLSHTVGITYGRWDVRLATGDRQPSQLPDPFEPLPACPPGMLTGSDSLPAKESPPGYPLSIEWDGIMVDDADHADDILRRVREGLEVIWKDKTDSTEKEASDILGVKELRAYFRKPGGGGFWDDHVKRYSKSRRRAPIYWLLQSSSKNYALWLYYHRLDKDLLFKALVNYVEPKVQRETNRLTELQQQMRRVDGSAKGAKKLAKEFEKQEDFLSELREFEDKLRRAADLHLEPDLNDGVVLNIAPLWELVPWKEAKNYWEELLDGKYEWSSIGKQLRQKGLVK